MKHAFPKQYFCDGCGVPILSRTHKKKHTNLCQSCNMKNVAADYNTVNRLFPTLSKSKNVFLNGTYPYFRDYTEAMQRFEDTKTQISKR